MMNKVLIVDDEPFEIELLSKIVSKAFGNEVEIKTAKNGRLAVSICSIWNADIVLMDIEMPGMNGIEAAKQIVNQKKSCKIIFITAYSLFDYTHEAIKLGACDYILKPVEEDDVVRSISTALGQLETQKQMQTVLQNIQPKDLEYDDLDQRRDKIDQLVDKVENYLKHNYMLYGLSLEFVSDMLNLNASYFSVMFKRCTGKNFVDYVSDLKIEAAKELLKDPLRSANEIATIVGMESASYFTRVFKKKTGLTPTEYRKNSYKKGNED